MAIIQCEFGHYYDDEKYAECPHCEEQIGEGDLTMSFVEEEERAHDKLAAMAGSDERTVGVFQARMKADPVVGWLVCMEGPERGRDYRIHTGRNFLGRSYGMDLTVRDDLSISREKHCSIVYDPKHGDFMLVPGEGTNTYVNSSLLKEPVRMEDGDAIGIGGSVFVFIAFCKGERTWL